jgi:hypothetical protein
LLHAQPIATLSTIATSAAITTVDPIPTLAVVMSDKSVA